MNAKRQKMVISPLWLQFSILTFLIGFSVLGYLAYSIYGQHPPIPEQVAGEDGSLQFTHDDIMAGQHLFQKYGLMSLFPSTVCSKELLNHSRTSPVLPYRPPAFPSAGEKNNMSSKKYHIILLIIALAFWTWSGIKPHDTRLTWVLETLPFMIALPIMLFTYKVHPTKAYFAS